jgi:hypothetical protein
VEISGLRDGTFFARLAIIREGTELLIDARPSDVIGIAVRRHCPVFIAESVVDEAGISVNLVTEGRTVLASDLPQANIGSASKSAAANTPESQRLQQELEEAITAEDYERAAWIRDRLKELGV